MKKTTLLIFIAFMTGCAVTKVPVISNTVQDTGKIEMGYGYGLLEKPVVKYDQALIDANAQCTRWGYAPAESKGQQDFCTQQDQKGNCIQHVVGLLYNCGFSTPTKTPVIIEKNPSSNIIEMEYQYTAMEKPKVDLEATKKVANDKCQSLGYNPINSKETQSESCVEYLSKENGGTCKKTAVSINYECQLTKNQLAKKEKDDQIAKEEARKAEEKANAESERQREEFAKKWPYTAVIECGRNNGSNFENLNLLACFTYDGVQTDIEITNNGRSRVYNVMSLANLGGGGNDEPFIQNGGGLRVNLTSSFSIRAQNAQRSLLLNLKIIKNSTREVIYEKQASQYGLVSAEN